MEEAELENPFGKLFEFVIFPSQTSVQTIHPCRLRVLINRKKERTQKIKKMMQTHFL
jgi:hypothetical protein